VKIDLILFASSNKGKVSEAQEIAARHSVALTSIDKLVANRGDAPEVEETATTFEGNALLKAEQYFSWSKLPTIADDSGLEVFALAGEPGIRSARYAGSGLPFERNIELLLSKLEGVEDRAARFICHLVLVTEPGDKQHFAGELRGSVTRAPAGSGGFGYDCIFQPEGHFESLATLKEQGSKIKTHRVLALERCFKSIAAKV